jgi:hypothetical protein
MRTSCGRSRAFDAVVLLGKSRWKRAAWVVMRGLLPRRSIHFVRSATIVRTGKENDGRVHWLIHINSIQQSLQLPPLASSRVPVVLVQISETSRDFHIRVRVGVDVENPQSCSSSYIDTKHISELTEVIQRF